MSIKSATLIGIVGTVIALIGSLIMQSIPLEPLGGDFIRVAWTIINAVDRLSLILFLVVLYFKQK